MSRYDEISADVECPYCGRSQRTAYQPQSHAAVEPGFRVVAVGDPFPLADDLEARGYLRIGRGPPDRTTILETFGCEVCGAWRWLRLEVKDGVLAAVTAVRFDDATLVATDYLAEDLAYELTDDERAVHAATGDPAVLRRAFLRIQDDIDAHRDDPVPDAPGVN